MPFTICFLKVTMHATQKSAIYAVSYSIQPIRHCSQNRRQEGNESLVDEVCASLSVAGFAVLFCILTATSDALSDAHICLCEYLQPWNDLSEKLLKKKTLPSASAAEHA